MGQRHYYVQICKIMHLRAHKETIPDINQHLKKGEEGVQSADSLMWTWVQSSHLLIDEDDVRQPDLPSGDTQHLNPIILLGFPRQPMIRPFLLATETKRSICVFVEHYIWIHKRRTGTRQTQIRTEDKTLHLQKHLVISSVYFFICFTSVIRFYWDVLPEHLS